MWNFKSIRGEEVTWYSEEEYNELKKENEMLKKLLEAHKILLESPIDIRPIEIDDMDWNGEEE